MTKTNPTIDWNSAPEGYPIWIHHHHAALGTVGLGGWHREEGDRYYNQDLCYWGKHCEGEHITVFHKPVETWHETGDLPPVGERVVIHYDVTDEDSRYVGHKGLEAVIIAHDEYDGYDIAIYRITNDERRRHEYHALVAKCFKPVPTEEEKAEMVREAFKAQFSQDWNSLNGDFYGRVKQLYDLGYRKQEDAQ